MSDSEVAGEGEGNSFFFEDSDSVHDEVEEEPEPTSFRTVRKDHDIIDADRRGVRRKSQVKFEDTDTDAES